MDPMDKEREIDQWLEGTLGQYGKAEPRTGLEGRVLANLRAERERIAARRRWWWAAATATALAAILATVWVGESGHEKNSVSTARKSTTTHREEARGSIQPGSAPQNAHPGREVGQRRPANRPMRVRAVAGPPKLEQFPSPQPLNDQEQLLARYAREFPEKAALVARVQTELQKENEREMAAPWPQKTGSMGLEQPE